MNVLLVSPASWYSTADVYAGLGEGFEQIGATVHRYRVETEYCLERTAVTRGLEIAARTDMIPPPGLDAKSASHDERRRYSPFFEEVSWRAWRPLPAEVIRARADMVVFVCPLQVNSDALWIASAVCRSMGVPSVAVFTESPYDDEKQAKIAPFFDYVFTNDLGSVQLASRALRGGGYLPTAYRQAVHYPSPGQEPRVDVSFVGVGFPERIRLLESVDWGGLGVSLALYGDWHALSAGSPLRGFVAGGVVPNTEAAEIYRSSRVCLNLMRSTVDYWGGGDGGAPGGKSLNPRAYEIAACGAAQVSEWREEWASVFGPEMLSCTFTTADGMMNAILELLADDGRRREVAGAQMLSVSGRHSYRQRAETITDIVGQGRR